MVSPADRTAGTALCCGSASLAFLHLLWGLREPQEESAALPPKLCIALAAARVKTGVPAGTCCSWQSAEDKSTLEVESGPDYFYLWCCFFSP